MELNELEKIDPMTVDFHGLRVTFNPDAFTSAFFYQASERFRSQFAPLAADAKENTATDLSVVEDLAQRIYRKGEIEDGERAFHITLLTGTPNTPVLLSWDLTNEGVPVPCNAEGLNTLKSRTLKALWECVRDAPLPKSQGIGTIPLSQTTNENTQSPSASPAIPADDTPIM